MRWRSLERLHIVLSLIYIHLDAVGEEFLKSNQTPITCSIKDEKDLKNRGLNVVNTVNYWQESNFLDGTIEGIPAKHGYGFVSKPMGNVMGFYVQLPNEKSLYLSADTIYTNDVEKVLHKYKPDVAVVACGTAQLDLFQPLLMTMEDIVKFTKATPGSVVANHLEAVNHCPTTRTQLREKLAENGLLEKTFIPNDGEVIEIE